MYVLFRCCKCELENKNEIEKKLKIHSYSWNKEKEPYVIDKLCDHFSQIELKWKTKYGFFTLGWQVRIYDVKVECVISHHKLCFQDQTFNCNNKSYEDVIDCCDNVIVYSAHEGKFDCSDDVKNLQRNINQIKEAKEKLKKLKEEEQKLEKE